MTKPAHPKNTTNSLDDLIIEIMEGGFESAMGGSPFMSEDEVNAHSKKTYQDTITKAKQALEAHIAKAVLEAQQQFLTELLGELPKEKTVNPGDFSYGREMSKSYNQGRADVVSVIEAELKQAGGKP
jgi:hypothetical protein